MATTDLNPWMSYLTGRANAVLRRTLVAGGRTAVAVVGKGRGIIEDCELTAVSDGIVIDLQHDGNLTVRRSRVRVELGVGVRFGAWTGGVIECCEIVAGKTGVLAEAISRPGNPCVGIHAKRGRVGRINAEIGEVPQPLQAVDATSVNSFSTPLRFSDQVGCGP